MFTDMLEDTDLALLVRDRMVFYERGFDFIPYEYLDFSFDERSFCFLLISSWPLSRALRILSLTNRTETLSKTLRISVAAFTNS